MPCPCSCLMVDAARLSTRAMLRQCSAKLAEGFLTVEPLIKKYSKTKTLTYGSPCLDADRMFTGAAPCSCIHIVGICSQDVLLCIDCGSLHCFGDSQTDFISNF